MADEKPIKVEKWDHNAVRIAMDDAAKKVILINFSNSTSNICDCLS